MKIYLNEGYVKRRSAIGKWTSLLGLVILAVGLVISLRSFKSLTQLYISLVSLLVGFILSNVGIYYANRYMRVDRPAEHDHAGHGRADVGRGEAVLEQRQGDGPDWGPTDNGQKSRGQSQQRGCNTPAADGERNDPENAQDGDEV